MTTVAEALSADDLEAALRLATEGVKAKPADTAARLLLIDVLVLSGDYERADRQADALAKLAPKDAVQLAILRGQIRGMDARAQWFGEGAVPSFPGGPTQADEAALRLAVALREGDGDAARTASDAIEAAREPITLAWNSVSAPDFRDADDRLPHALEVISTGGVYLWIDFSRLAKLALQPIHRPRDLAFRRAELTLKSGSVAEVLVPAIYGGAGNGAAHLLGRETGWAELPGGLVAGRGQRCFLVGEELQPLSDTETLQAEAGDA
ncbi:MAG: nitrogen fixation protein [Mesorhizobium amorphae]|nr:MAG: nitrogen fixation protein [Mesorhizobium amorphae]